MAWARKSCANTARCSSPRSMAGPMPELPEVETVRRGLAPTMEGRRIESVELRRANLRLAFPEDFAARLTGRRVLALGRRAKYLLAGLEGGETLIMHLGMSGSFR